MTKKILLAAALMLAGQALWALSRGEFRAPTDADKRQAENTAWVGLSVSSKSADGTVTNNSKHQFLDTYLQWVTGAGVLNKVMIATGAATTYVVCADSAPERGDLPTIAQIHDPEINLLFPPYFANASTAACVMGGFSSCPNLDLEFRNGLGCMTNADLHYIPVFRRKDD